MNSVTLSEAKRLMRGWARATQETVADSIRYHFRKHGGDVAAASVWQYLRKAYGRRRSLRGARRITLDEGKVRYTKNERFLILDAQGKIISFGSEKNNDND
jgi:hypothetical protein